MEKFEYENPALRGLMSALGPGMISTLPAIGPVVAEYFNGATLARWHNRIVEYVENLDSDFQRYKEYVDNEYIKSEEFEDLFADLLIEASKISREELRGLYRSISLAAAIDGSNSQLKAKRVSALLQSLTVEHFYVLRAVEEADWKSFDPDRRDDWIGKQVRQLERSIGIPVDLGMDAAIYVTDLLHLNLLKGVIAWDGTFVLDDPDDETVDVSKYKAVTWRGEEVLKYLWPELSLIC